MSTSAPLGGLAPTQFLRDCWQKQPLLVRHALPDFRDPVTPEQLAGLACEPEVESRLILEHDGAQPWQVRHGPFTTDDFSNLPETRWTLLVQEANRHVPALARLLDHFRFIPQWRGDDVMVSFAPPQGSVGPHTDEYDVFLLQGLGRRRWQINTAPVDDDAYLPDLELRILAAFEPRQEWVLEAGDMLYLPPGVAHYGVALEDCLTYSVGFRAPTRADMLMSFLDCALSTADVGIRFRDPDLELQEHSGEISGAALRKVRNMIRDLPLDDQTIDHWFGSFITEAAPGKPGAPPLEPPLTATEFTQALIEHGTLYRSEHARFAFIHTAHGAILFVDGLEYPLSGRLARAAPLICDGRAYSTAILEAHLRDPAFLALVLELTNRGYLYFDDNHG